MLNTNKIAVISSAKNLDAITILNLSLQENFEDIIVIGRKSNGETSILSSSSYIPDIIFFLEKAKNIVLNDQDEPELLPEAS